MPDTITQSTVCYKMPECYFLINLSFLVELSPEIDDSDMQDLWIRQIVAEIVVLQGNQLSLLTQ